MGKELQVIEGGAFVQAVQHQEQKGRVAERSLKPVIEAFSPDIFPGLADLPPGNVHDA